MPRPVVGVDSCEVTGTMASGWPTGPSQRIAIGVKATRKDARVQNYVVAVTVGQWRDGARAAVTPGKPSEARAWVFGCWLALQAFLGRHQVNIPHRQGREALQQGPKSVLAADLWRSMAAEEWTRLKPLHVPQKMLKGAGEDMRAWMQFDAARQCAQQRASKPDALVHALQEADRWHHEVYLHGCCCSYQCPFAGQRPLHA